MESYQSDWTQLEVKYTLIFGISFPCGFFNISFRLTNISASDVYKRKSHFSFFSKLLHLICTFPW